MKAYKRIGQRTFFFAVAIPLAFLVTQQMKPQKPSGAEPVAPSAIPSKLPSTEKYFSAIVWCVMENKGYKQVKDLPSHRYLAAHGASLTNYRDAGHPSGPNYRVLVSSRDWTREQTYNRRVPTVATLMNEIGLPTLNWQYWGKPVLKHDPYRDLKSDVIEGADEINPDRFPTNGQIFLGVDDMNNSHDGPLAKVDENLTRLIEKLEGSKWFHEADSLGRYPVLAVLYDESFLGDGHIFAAFIGQGVKAGFVSNRRYDHFDFCRTLTDNWGLAPLGAASGSSPINDIWK